MKNQFIIFFIVFFISLINFSQELPKIIPPSPVAYELGKYGQIPVGMFTGTPNINIPLYTYKTKNLAVPISLSYNSNGIKVDQLSSNVGLGWSLNAGGVITRIIRDKPDEERGTFFPEEEIQSAGVRSPMALDYFYEVANNDLDSETDLFMYNFMGYSGKFVYDKNGEIILTSQKDLKIEGYSETIAGALKTGFKVIDGNGIVYIFLEDEINISRTSGNGHGVPSLPSITAWYLTQMEHPNGDVIEFIYEASNYFYISGKSESFTIATPTYQNGCPGSTGTSVGYVISPEITNKLTIAGKQLVKIKATHAELGEVSITSNFPHPEVSSHKMIDNITVKDKNLLTVEKFDLKYLATANNRVFLKNINFLDPSKNYQFDYIDPSGVPSRLSKSKDYWGYYNGKTNQYRFPNPQDDFIKELIDIGFSNYNLGADKSINPLNAKKGLLKKIVYPTKGYNEFEYESNSYFGENTTYPQSTNLYVEANTDENGMGSNYEVSDITNIIPFNQKADFYVGVSFNSSLCDPSMDLLKSKASISIVDSHGDNVIIQELTQNGYVAVGTNSITVSYDSPNNHFYVDLKEGHTYTFKVKPTFTCVKSSLSLTYYDEDTITISTNTNLGGLRIKSIKAFDLATSSENFTRYYYGKKETLNKSSADKGQRPFYISKITNRIKCNIEGALDCSYEDQFFQSLNSNSLRQLYSSSSSGTTYYKYVTVSHGGDDFENGGEEHDFIINNDVHGKVLYGDHIESSPLVNSGWSNGFEKKSTIFKKGDSNNLITLRETINSFIESEQNFKKVYGYSTIKKFNLICTKDITYECTEADLDKVYKYNTSEEPIYLPHPCNGKSVGTIITYPNQLENLDIMEYSTNSYWHYLDQTIEIQFDSNGLNPMETITNYFYDNDEHLQLTRSETTDSNGVQLKTQINYPQDLEIKTPAEEDLITRHRIAIPIKTSTFKKEGINDVEKLSTQYIVYNKDKWPGLNLPEIIQISKGTDNPEDRIIYHDYDNKGNPLEVSKTDGTHIYYLWGYHQTQPIAKIENFTATDATNLQGLIDTAIAASNVDDDNCRDTGCKEQALRITLKAIQNAATNTQMTYYTYDPLIGVTSITDPRGQTVYYEYDDFNRLKYVKDTEGNIISKNEYNYATSPQN